MKALMPLHTQAPPKAFFDGREPWPICAIPFGGPLPSPNAPRGVDLDGQFFSENTDLVGPYAALKASRDRLVDWHHSLRPEGGRGGDPLGVMNGVVLGKAVLREEPEESGWWVDFWAKAGERRLELVQRLVERGTQLFASAQPTASADTAVNKATGEILRYPFLFLTITTSPQNTFAVVRPKAMLDDAIEQGIDVAAPICELVSSLDAIRSDLPQTFPSPGGDAAAMAVGLSKASQEALSTSLEPWEATAQGKG